MKGGTTYGQCTVHRCAVPPHGVPRFHQFDPRGISGPGSALRGRVPSAYDRVAPRWETPDCPPVCRVPELPPADAGRPAVLPAHLPEDLCPPGGTGALVRHSQSKANQWIHVLLPVLLATLRTLGDAPTRSLTALAQRLGVSEAAAATVVVPLVEEPVPVGAIPAAVPASPLLPMTGRNGASSAPKTLLNRLRVIAARKRTIQ